MPKTKSLVPKIGYLTIADPRLGPQLFAEIMQASAAYAKKLQQAGIELLAENQVVDTEAKARQAVETMRAKGAGGLILRIAWFHRSNVTACSAQNSGLPCFLWALPNRNDASLIGLGVAHGALDELGIRHGLHYGDDRPESLAKIKDWASACAVKQALMGAVYGEIGGRCLEMIPMSSDDNQLRKLFGIHVDPMEQWTLVRLAEKIPAPLVRKKVAEWQAQFKLLRCQKRALERSARIYLAGKTVFAEKKWSFAGIQCQPDLIDNYLAPCLPIALWNDEGFVIACENDINNALGMFVAQRMTGRAVMFADIQHYDLDQNIIRLLNCGMAPPSLVGGLSNVELHDCPKEQGSWDEKKQKSLCQGGACTHFVLPAGEVTLVRFGRIDGRYVIHLVEGEALSLPHDRRELLGIAGVWPFAYVRPRAEPEGFLRNMRAHHCVIVPEACAAGIRELADLYQIEILAS